jgi:hypothetical protein
VPRSRKSGYAPVGMTNWRAAAHLDMGGGGGRDPINQRFHTYLDCPLIQNREWSILELEVPPGLHPG